jgi:polyprenyl P-hydroxybenzoate/phenylacrylic acid decarboxylase-like protein
MMRALNAFRSVDDVRVDEATGRVLQSPPAPAPPLVIAMTGATGVIYGIRLLEFLKEARVETDLVMSLWAKRTIIAETDKKPADVASLATRTWEEHDLTAPVASPAFATRGMIVAPCSMRSLGAIATGISDNLVHRAADVTLQLGRKLLLLVRESPLSVIHLENMLRVAKAGGMIVPPVSSFYARPRSLEDAVDHTVGRVLDQFGMHGPSIRRWGDKLSMDDRRVTGGAPRPDTPPEEVGEPDSLG